MIKRRKVLVLLNSIFSSDFRPSDKNVYLKINFLIAQSKHMLWVLQRTVSMRRFFWAPKICYLSSWIRKYWQLYTPNVCLSGCMWFHYSMSYLRYCWLTGKTLKHQKIISVNCSKSLRWVVTVNVLKFRTLYSFCSQLKCWHSGLEFTKCLSE